jgi:hypothetical protein
MTPETTSASYQVTRARVAGTRLLVIHEVDGVPSTHTELAAALARKVAETTPHQAPHSFAASAPRSRWTLIPWWSLTLSVLALATLGATTAVLQVPALIGAAAAVCLAGCCLVLVVAEIVHRVTAMRRTGPMS